MSYIPPTDVDTVHWRHRNAKFNIRQIVNVLLGQKIITTESAKMIIEQLNRIEDDALSMFSDYVGKVVEYEIQGIGGKEWYRCEFKITKL